MNDIKDYSQSRFSDRIRIDPTQKEWIREYLTEYKTLAGRLDFIINFFKKNYKKLNK